MQRQQTKAQEQLKMCYDVALTRACVRAWVCVCVLLGSKATCVMQGCLPKFGFKRSWLQSRSHKSKPPVQNTKVIEIDKAAPLFGDLFPTPKPALVGPTQVHVSYTWWFVQKKPPLEQSPNRVALSQKLEGSRQLETKSPKTSTLEPLPDGRLPALARRKPSQRSAGGGEGPEKRGRNCSQAT